MNEPTREALELARTVLPCERHWPVSRCSEQEPMDLRRWCITCRAAHVSKNVAAVATLLDRELARVREEAVAICAAYVRRALRSRDIALDGGRESVGSHRQSDAETAKSIARAIRALPLYGAEERERGGDAT